jgi:2-hydroxy-3-keto-5-methylthiopentenyl-1-phosphate phosphatase
MDESYIPKATEWEFCEWINLCTVRKTKDWISKVWIKDISWNIKEEILETIINSDTYNWKNIVRVYSSWHVFLSDNKDKVFLTTTQKDWKTQIQFTWWSPIEEENKEVIYKDNWIYKFDIEKVRKNARMRTKNRTWVDIIEEHNKKPIVDWTLIENEENWKSYYKLVCLMHFIVKKYEWTLSYTWNENIIWWDWYKIDELPSIKNIAPNAYIVSKKAVELLSRLWETVIIADFSKTISSHKNPTTWSVFAKSWFLWSEYTNDRNRYYEEYHDYELKWDIEKTKQWWWKHLELFTKYWLTKELIDKITSTDYFTVRQWLNDFIKIIQNKWIKLFIVSSWVSEFIRSFLNQNNISKNQIEIHGNDLIFDENWTVIWFDEKSIITPLNKNQNKFDLELYWKVILLWDDSSDLSMYSWDCLKIWFCNSNNVKWYDIYLWNNGDLKEVLDNI